MPCAQLTEQSFKSKRGLLGPLGTHTVELMRVAIISSAFAAAFALAACTPFPELEDQVSEEAKTADYLPFLEVKDLISLENVAPIEPAAPIDARIAALRARAAALRSAIFTPRERDRLSGGLR